MVYTSPSGGTRVGGAGDTYVPTSIVTLYAHWSPYKKIFDYTDRSMFNNWGNVSYNSYSGGYSYTGFAKGEYNSGGYITANLK